MNILIYSILVYLFLGICYAIDFFHQNYETMVLDEGINVGEFFVLTIITGLLWPIMIIIFAILDIRNER